jgi:hypothetical protein
MFGGIVTMGGSCPPCGFAILIYIPNVHKSILVVFSVCNTSVGIGRSFVRLKDMAIDDP